MRFEIFTLAIPSVALEVAGKGALISLTVLGMIAVLRRASAASRHLLLVLAAGSLLLLPVLMVALPSREFAVLPVEPAQPVAVTGPAQDGHGLSQIVISRPAQPVQRAAPPTNLRLPTAAGLALFVLAVSGLLLARLLLAVWRLTALYAGSLPAPQDWLELFDELRGRLKVRQTVRLGISKAVAVPVTFGWLRPVVLLPEAARGWEDAQLREALLHELAHVRRHDWPLQMIARAARALHWFNPLVWLLSRRLLLEAELACDDQVLRAGTGPAGYAGRLVALAREVRNASRRPAEAVAFARPSGLASRVASILDPGRRRGRPGRIAVAGAAVSALILLLLVAPARLVRAEQRSAMQKAVREGVEGGVDDGIADGIAGGITDGITGGVAGGLEEGKQEALIEAAEHGDFEAVRFLVRQGADPNGAVPGDGSPLIAAAGKGSEEIVLFLLEQGADPNLGVSGDGSPLIAAAEGGHAGVVRLLLKAGADIDQVVPGDENPLIQAAWKGHLEVVRLLLDSGAYPNVSVNVNRSPSDPGGELRSPLSMARRGGHRDVERLLLERGARE